VGILGGKSFNLTSPWDAMRPDVSGISPVALKPLKEAKQELGNFESAALGSIMSVSAAIEIGVGNAWTKVFGEANSLLEIFAKRFAELMASLAASFGAFKLLSFIFPGSAGLFGSFFGFGGSVANAGSLATQAAISKSMGGQSSMGGRIEFVQRGSDLVAVYDRSKRIVSANQF